MGAADSARIAELEDALRSLLEYADHLEFLTTQEWGDSTAEERAPLDRARRALGEPKP